MPARNVRRRPVAVHLANNLAATVVSLRLRCTVRGCASALARRDAALVCAHGHAFDRAREGYWNLLQPQDRRSDKAGDRVESIEARRRWLARGFAEGLLATLAETVRTLAPSPPAAIDVGCGEGTIASRVLSALDVPWCGVDLSTAAIRMAARLDPSATWLVANADRGLPFEDASVGLALTVFGRRPAAELGRVLASGAFLVVVLPGPDDLVELREAALGRGERRERAGDALASLAPVAEVVASTRWRGRARHDRAAIADALAMSYRGARAAERRRWEGLEALEVTLDAEILAMRRF